MKKLLLILFAFILSGGMAWGETILQPGDIAIYGINTDNDDAFGFVALVNIPANTTINFTDNGVLADGSLRTGENTLTWSSSTAVTKGTVVTWEGGIWSVGSSTGTGPAFSYSGDQCIAYTGTTSSPTYIYAVNIANDGWITSGDLTSNTSYLPTGLTNGINAISVGTSDNGYYSGTTTGTVSNLLSTISNPANWTTSNSRIDLSNWPTSFTVTSPDNPSDFTASPASTTQIDLSWAQNADNDDVMVAWSTDGTFGTPTDGTPYSAGDAITGGGTVIYNGSATSYNHTGLTPGTHYYYKAWSVNSSTNYSTGVTADALTANNLIISEVADPGDSTDAKFVEIYNLSSSDIDLSTGNWYLVKQVNGGTYYHVALSGTIPAGGTYVVAYNIDNFNYSYGFDPDQASGYINGNGDDGYFLYYGGDETTGILIDAYGVPDVDGTGEAWEYTDSRAVRNSSVTAPNTTWTASEWTITSANVADMTPGTHGNCITWKGATDTTWNTAGNWVGGTVPLAATNIKIPNGAANYPSVNGDAAAPTRCNNLYINGGKLTIPVGKALTVGLNLVNNAGNAGLEIQSDATGNGSLIVYGTATGGATVQRYIAAYSSGTGTGNGWHEISSPVNNVNILGSDFEPGADDDLYTWDETNNIWSNYKQLDGIPPFTTYENGKGYLVASDTTGVKSFSGTLNISNIYFDNLSYNPSEGDGWHLLGNPYSCALKWGDSNWGLTGIAGTAKVWKESAGNYIDVASDSIIPSTNGFFVQATNATNSLIIPAIDRVHDATNNYKTAQVQQETLKFKVTNDANGYYDAAILGFKANATKDCDNAFDSHKLFTMVKTAPSLWTVSQKQNFSTNYLPETTTDDVPLDFKPGANTIYHLSWQGIKSFDNRNFVLEDLKTGEKIDLNNTDSYDFNAEEGDDVNRFVLHINGITAVPNTKEADGIQVFSYGNTVYLHGQKALNGKVSIFNTLGQKVYEGSLNGVAKQQISLNQRAGIYFVRVEENNHLFTQKVFIK